ncbi:hypothetical protein Ddc_14252 [Ditylenchus destructor]|nr:hypothetical protein Ddc_14252 [Ditylenchus destructor]
MSHRPNVRLDMTAQADLILKPVNSMNGECGAVNDTATVSNAQTAQNQVHYATGQTTEAFIVKRDMSALVESRLELKLALEGGAVESRLNLADNLSNAQTETPLRKLVIHHRNIPAPTLTLAQKAKNASPRTPEMDQLDGAVNILAKCHALYCDLNTFCRTFFLIEKDNKI